MCVRIVLSLLLVALCVQVCLCLCVCYTPTNYFFFRLLPLRFTFLFCRCFGLVVVCVVCVVWVVCGVFVFFWLFRDVVIVVLRFGFAFFGLWVVFGCLGLLLSLGCWIFWTVLRCLCCFGLSLPLCDVVVCVVVFVCVCLCLFVLFRPDVMTKETHWEEALSLGEKQRLAIVSDV